MWCYDRERWGGKGSAPVNAMDRIKPDSVLGVPPPVPKIFQKNILLYDSAKKIRSICI
jgi:hypothetical protein